MAIELQTVGLMALAAAVAAMATLRVTRSGGFGGPKKTPAPCTIRHDAGGAGSAALFDPDDMKAINVAQGFDTGDRLLDAVGDTLRRGLPPMSGLERLGNGRFLLWMPDLELAEAVELVEEMRALAAKTLVEGRNGQVACELTAAVVEALPDEGRSRTILRADALLAQAKARGGARTEANQDVLIPTLAPSRSEIEAAIKERELEYHVQPIVTLETAKPVGVEALLRWKRSDGSIVGPSGFIDTLTRIPDAGSDLLADLAVETAQPFVTGPEPIYVTFNITGAVLDSKDSSGCSWLIRLMEFLPAEHLVLELVETAVIVKTERALDLTRRTRAKGVRIALDDFGTGLSNIERLCDFPVDLLKIDKAFVRALGGNGRAEIIVQNLVSMARELDIGLIAEGIETEDQARRLRNLGVDFGQGFLYGRPAPAAEWAERMDRSGG